MTDISPHIPIHEAADPKSFLSAFAETTGRTLQSLIAEYVTEGEVLAIVLGGSIPLGIATVASDVDVLVLLNSKNAFRNRAISGKSVLFSGRSATDDELTMGTAVFRHGGAEIDVQFLLSSKLRQLLQALRGSGVAISLQQRQIVGRLRKGWLLDRNEWPDDACFLFDVNFDIRCATHSLIMAYRWMIDAKVASRDNWRLSLSMGRQSVDKAFEAYFASLGFSALGFKWLRFLDRHFDAVTGETRGKMPANLAERGQNLLFPLGVASTVPGFVIEVESFVRDVRRIVEGRVPYRVAFEVSPHMNWPRVVDGTEQMS